ncbi:MAG: hypothetical protein IPI69_16100 [Bacteroidales bacterium]|nr:hypothetical protein [Bacteroidales bacterium]
MNSHRTSSDIVRVTFHDKPNLNAGDDVPFVAKEENVQLNATGQGSFCMGPNNIPEQP